MKITESLESLEQTGPAQTPVAHASQSGITPPPGPVIDAEAEVGIHRAFNPEKEAQRQRMLETFEFVEGYIYDNVMFLLNRIRLINRRLLRISELLRAQQPRQPGAVLLDFIPFCGNGARKFCPSCPHSRWLQWDTKQIEITGSRRPWFARVIQNPVQRLRRTGDFAMHYETNKTLIREAQALIQERQRLLGHFRAINKAGSQMRDDL